MDSPAENENSNTMENLTTNSSIVYENEEVSFHISETASTMNTNNDTGDLQSGTNAIAHTMPINYMEFVNAVNSNATMNYNPLCNSFHGVQTEMNPMYIQDGDNLNDTATVFNGLQSPQIIRSSRTNRGDITAGGGTETAMSHANDFTLNDDKCSSATTLHLSSQSSQFNGAFIDFIGEKAAGVQANILQERLTSRSPVHALIVGDHNEINDATFVNCFSGSSIERDSLHIRGNTSAGFQPVSEDGTVSGSSYGFIDFIGERAAGVQANSLQERLTSRSPVHGLIVGDHNEFNDATLSNSFSGSLIERDSTNTRGNTSAGVQPDSGNGTVIGSSHACDVTVNNGNFMSDATELNILPYPSVGRRSLIARHGMANGIQPNGQVGVLTGTTSIVGATVNNNNVMSMSADAALLNNFQIPQINRHTMSVDSNLASVARANNQNDLAANTDLRHNAFLFSGNHGPGTARNFLNIGGTEPDLCQYQQMVYDNTMINGVRPNIPFLPGKIDGSLLNFGFDGNFVAEFQSNPLVGGTSNNNGNAVPNQSYALHERQAHGSFFNFGGNMRGHASTSGSMIPWNTNAGIIQTPQGNGQNYSCRPSSGLRGNRGIRYANTSPYNGLQVCPRAASRPFSINQGALHAYELVKQARAAIHPSTAMRNPNVPGHPEIQQGYVNTVRGMSAKSSLMSSLGSGMGRTTSRNQSGAENSSKVRPSSQSMEVPRPPDRQDPAAGVGLMQTSEVSRQPAKVSKVRPPSLQQAKLVADRQDPTAGVGMKQTSEVPRQLVKASKVRPSLSLQQAKLVPDRQNPMAGVELMQTSGVPRPPAKASKIRPSLTTAIPAPKRKMGPEPPSFYLKWKGFREPGHSVRENCYMCKRGLSFTPKGPLSQPSVPPVIAVLPCGHTFHDECLRLITPQEQEKDPPCIPCAIGTSSS